MSIRSVFFACFSLLGGILILSCSNTNPTGSSSNQPPTAIITSSGTTIYSGDSIRLSASSSTDPENDPLVFRWLIDGNSQKEGSDISFRSTSTGYHTIILGITDIEGNNAYDTISIQVKAPVPKDGLWSGSLVSFTLSNNGTYISSLQCGPLYFSGGKCSSSNTTVTMYGISVSGLSFSRSSSDLSITGRFTSAFRCEGTYSYEAYSSGCGVTFRKSGNWVATWP